MKSSFWTPYISDHTIHAICWTLIHSLWIGLAIALLSGLVITITRKSDAALRYNLLCGVLMLFALSVYVTFCLEMRTPVVEQGTFHARQIIHAPGNLSIIVPATTPHISLIGRTVMFLNEYSNIIFMVWLLFFVLKSLKMAGGLLYIQRIRNYRVHEVSEEFKHKIEMFAGQIGIRQVVRLVQSELVKVPVAVGWLKPMILLPMGIILQLSPEQLESILWHELAHIRRRDYLVNILQGIVETMFFFNPGLLWLSSLIRAEREACCDDIVLSRMNRKANYLEALLSFGYEDNSKVSFAMSIGSGNQLRDRLKRMVSQENKRLSIAEKVVLAAGLVLLSAFTTISKDNTVIKNLIVKFRGKSGKVITKNMTVSMHRLPEGQRMNDSMPGAREKHAIIVTDTSIRFTSVLFKNSDADPANNDIRAMDEKGTKYHFVVVGDKIASMEINGEKVAENKLPEYNYMLRTIKAELAEKKRVRDNDVFRLKESRDQYDTDAEHIRISIDSLKSKGQSFRKSPPPRNPKDMSPEPYAAKLAAMQRQFRDDSVNYTSQRDRAFNVIADLVDDKVVPEPATVKWFGLSSTEFIVNGMKQPSELQQKYMIKYGVRPDYGLYYGPVRMHGKGVFIDVTDSRPPLPPGKPRKPKAPQEPRSGWMQPALRDSEAWKTQQLIHQQEAFAADQEKKRQHIIKQQEAFVADKEKKRRQTEKEQQAFAAEQDKKREQIVEEQERLSADQARKYKLLMQQQQQELKMQQKWLKDDRWAKHDIDIQTAITGIVADLVNANVLNDKSDLIKFNLTNSALMVNGKKQSEELHQKLKDKYLQDPNYQLTPGITNNQNFGLHFNAQTGGMGLGITDGPDSP
ncbi:MAG TPA: M56 family metallopeptidase [Mucilaginibacter sp.]|nr:M56 family metallopeptidase [Mucilaginibacter sp.]